MPTNRVWRGDYPDRVQIERYQVSGNVSEATDLTWTFPNGKAFTAQATGDTLQALVNTFVQKWIDNQQSYPELAEITPSLYVDGLENVFLQLDGVTPGVPFEGTLDGPNPHVDVDTVQDGAPGQNEIQSFTFSPDPSGGFFNILWDLGSGVETSANIAYDATADVVKSAMIATMPSLTVDDVEVEDILDGYKITLQGAYAQASVGELSVDTSNLTGNGQVTVSTTVQGNAGLNEVQRFSLSSGVNGGTFTLTFDGQTTGNIAYNADASTVQTALEALSNVAPGDVSVVKSGTIWTVTFAGVYAKTNVPEMTGDGANLTSSGGSMNILTLQNGEDAGFNVYTLSLGVGHGLNPQVRFRIGATLFTPYRALSSWTQAQLISDIQAVTGSGTVFLRGGYRSHPNGNSVSFVLKWIGSMAFNTGSVTLEISGGGSVAAHRVNAGYYSTLRDRDEVQYINLLSATAGTFTITYDGQTTSALAWNCTAAQVQTALEALSNLGSGDVEVYNGVNGHPTSQSQSNKGIITIKFKGTLTDTDVPEITLGVGSLVGSASKGTISEGDAANQRNELQRIIVNASGGTFTLTFDGQTTGNISVGATAGDVQTALEALSNIAPGDVEVTGTGTSGDPYLIEFKATYAATNVPQITGSVGSLTGGSVDVTTITQGLAPTNEVQTVYHNGQGGTFTLTYSGQTTGAIAWDASAAAIKAALEALSNVDLVDVSGTGTIDDPWVIEFQGSLAGTNIGQMTGSGSGLTGGFDSTILTIQDGHDPYDEIWHVVIIGASGGTVKYEYLDQQTADLAYNHNAAALEAALEALDGIGAGNVTVTGAGSEVDPFEVTLNGALSTGDDRPQLIAYNEDLTGTGHPTTISKLVVQSCTGRHWANEPMNWEDTATGLRGLPETGDNIYIEQGDTNNSLLYGLDLSAIDINSYIQSSLFEGDIGLPVWNDLGYAEYRGRYLHFGMKSDGDKSVLVGNGQGSGSGLTRLTFGSDEAHLRVERTAGPKEGTKPAFVFLGNNALSRLELFDGFAGLGVFAYETWEMGPIVQRGGLLSMGCGMPDLGEVASLDKTGGDLYVDNVNIGGSPLIFRG